MGRTLESVIFHYLLYLCWCAVAESAAGTKWLWVEAALEVLDLPAICVACVDFGAAVCRRVGPHCSLPSFPSGGCHAWELLRPVPAGALQCWLSDCLGCAFPFFKISEREEGCRRTCLLVINLIVLCSASHPCGVWFFTHTHPE